MKRNKTSSTLPFTFVLDHLYPIEPEIKPMFGCFALYVNKKIVLILRKRNEHSEFNGVWLVTSREHHEGLRKMFPSMKSIVFLGEHPTNWQALPETADDFEESVIRACELIVKGDPRIGKIPKRKIRKGT